MNASDFRRALSPLTRISLPSGADFVITRVLGEGANGFACLILAMAGRLAGQIFVLKVLKDPSDAFHVARFQREHRTLAKDEHPAIPRVLDSGELVLGGEQFPFFVTDYFPRNLRTTLQGGRIPVIRALSFGTQLFGMLSYLEKRDPWVIHRDIKPENIFVLEEKLVLGDYGAMKIGREVTDSEKDRSFITGTLSTPFPRNYRSQDLVEYSMGLTDLTTKSDVFQAGLVLVEMLTGKNVLNPPRSVGAELNKLSPVELGEPPEFSGRHAARLQSLSQQTLEMKAKDRINAEMAHAITQDLLRDCLSEKYESTGEGL